MLISANAVTTITTNSREQPHRVERVRDAGDERPDDHAAPAPASTALIVPERLKPAISSSFVIGVTR